jgi:hypothetical protein
MSRRTSWKNDIGVMPPVYILIQHRRRLNEDTLAEPVRTTVLCPAMPFDAVRRAGEQQQGQDH